MSIPHGGPPSSANVTSRDLGDLGYVLSQSQLVVVGSGLYGLTIAERAAEILGINVAVVEKRLHPGGNSWSHRDGTTGIEIHDYGTHLFHTNNERIWNYANRFTGFNDYRHFVMANSRGGIYPMPINLQTINSFFGQAWSPTEARSHLGLGDLRISSATNLEERAIELVGVDLYEAFIKGYTAKQWQLDPRELPAEVISRLPFRLSYQSGYFKDRFQGLPLEGYDHWISAMLRSPRISLFLGVDYFDIQSEIPRESVTVFTGPLDRYFSYSHGPLGWRTLDFEIEVVPVGDYQGCSVMNYCDADIPWTRIHEFRHLHPERTHPTDQTVVMREYSRWANTAEDEPYYPVNSALDRERLERYRAMARRESRTFFGGRLGSYQYLDMHMALGAALRDFEDQISPSLMS